MKKSIFSLVAAMAVVSANTLDPIVVSATKSEVPLSKTTSNMQIITGDELEQKHITSVIDALRMLSGINITQSGGAGQQSSFFQRGMSAGNTVVMIDGVRYNDPTGIETQAQLEHLMTQNIEQIEIINGAQSGIWGSNASAGVINIITKKASQELSVGANMEYGSYGTTKVGANISQKIDAFSYYFGASRLNTSGFSAQVPNKNRVGDYEKDGYTNESINAKLGYEISSSDILRASFNYINAKIDYDGFMAPNDSESRIKQINKQGEIGYRHYFDSDVYLDASYSVAKFDKNDPTAWTKRFTGSNREFNSHAHIGYHGTDSLVIGLNRLDTKDKIADKNIASRGIFATNTNIFGDLVLTESIRYDKYSDFDSKTTGKIGAKYNITNNLFVSSNVGSGFRAPSLYQLYDGWSGNKDLKPEKSKSFDATVGYGGLSVTYFYNNIENFIDWNGKYQNIDGKSRFQGYEASYTQNIGDSLALDGSYTRLYAKNSSGAELPRRAKNLYKASATYFLQDALSINLNAQYIGERYDNATKTTQTGKYAVVGGVVNYQLNPNIELFARFDNLFDRYYQEVDGYATAGRSAYAGLRVNY